MGFIGVICGVTIQTKIVPITEIAKKSGLADTGILDEYHISDRDEGHDNDDDEEGSRTYPSRTSAGASFSYGEKHPELTQPLVLFWGLLTIPNWYMDWVLSNAKLELLMRPAYNFL